MRSLLFAGILINTDNLIASVINPKGRAVMSSQYHTDSTSHLLPKVMRHLTQFARMNSAALRLGICNLALSAYDHHGLIKSCSPHQIFFIQSSELYEADLPRHPSSFRRDDYCDSIVVATICALKYAANPDPQYANYPTDSINHPYLF